MERAEKLTELTSIQEQAIARADAITRIDELLEDEDLEVRLEALKALSSYPEAHDLWKRVLKIAAEDPGPVRVGALVALGRVICEGDLAGAREEGYAPEQELGEPPLDLFEDARLALIERLADPASPEESRVALASLSYLADEPSVVAAIEAAQEGEASDKAWALRCMGLGGDGQRWGAAIREAVEEDEEALMVEAVRAAGRTEQVELAPLLGRILKGSRQPEPLRIAAAEALAGLGGKAGAAHLLEVAESGDQGGVGEAAREALASLTNPPDLKAEPE
jgi:HEAT repeat protein